MLVWNILKTVAVDWSAGNFVQVVLKVWEMHQWMPKNFSHNLMFMVHGWLMFIPDWRVRWMMMYESCMRLPCHAWDSEMAIWHKVSPRRSDKVAHKASDTWLFHVFVEMTWILNLLLSEGHATHVEICQCWNLESRLADNVETKMKQNETMKEDEVYHESIIWIYESWYVCSRLAKDFYLRDKEAQVVGNTCINQAKQDSLDQLTFLCIRFFKMIYVERVA